MEPLNQMEPSNQNEAPRKDYMRVLFSFLSISLFLTSSLTLY